MTYVRRLLPENREAWVRLYEKNGWYPEALIVLPKDADTEWITSLIGLRWELRGRNLFFESWDDAVMTTLRI